MTTTPTSSSSSAAFASRRRRPDQEILQGIDLTVGKGEVHAIMGPNGSGKTTLAYALMGHPAYVVTAGEVIWKGRDILKLSPDKRARLGLFLAFQYPTAIPGLSVASFIRSALNAKLQGIDKDPDVDPTDAIRGGVSMRDFRNKMREKMALLRMDEGFAAATSTTASRAARRSASRCSRWPSSSPRWRSSTRPTRGSTSTRCASSPRASMRCSARSSASC